MIEFKNVIAEQTSKAIYSLPLASLPKDAILVCDITCGETHDRAFYKDGTLPLVPCSTLQLIEQTEHYITLSSAEYVHVVELEGEFIFEDNYFSLLPNEHRTIRFRPIEHAQSDELSISSYTIR